MMLFSTMPQLATPSPATSTQATSDTTTSLTYYYSQAHKFSSHSQHRIAQTQQEQHRQYEIFASTSSPQYQYSYSQMNVETGGDCTGTTLVRQRRNSYHEELYNNDDYSRSSYTYKTRCQTTTRTTTTTTATEETQQAQQLQQLPLQQVQQVQQQGKTTRGGNRSRTSRGQTTSNVAIRKRKTKKNKIIIPFRDMIRLLTLPQPIAAKKLKISVSTLKRRYYELDMGRWPANYLLQDDVNCEPMPNPVALQSSFHQECYSTICQLHGLSNHQQQRFHQNNSNNNNSNTSCSSSSSSCGNSSDDSSSSVQSLSNPGVVSLYKEPTQKQKEHMGTVLNLYDVHDAKYIDHVTSMVLCCAFQAHLEEKNS